MPSVYRVNLLEQRLQKLTAQISGVIGTVIVSGEGFVVAAYTPSEDRPDSDALSQNTPQVAAMSATLLALGDQTLRRLAQGDMSRMLIEGDDGALIVYPIAARAALAVLVAKSTRLGLALIAVERTAADVATILDGGTPLS